eukprot:TRINITY_DN1793_c0_g1_i1.p1 TRINITY_DN1793_c0_g1~~TRINITY_DN1793_c0_g1_i1.p1  ORF type:complete len:250 (-),score=74.64 TRINITY_DN1793_c0_g1_i1:124-873(-)
MLACCSAPVHTGTTCRKVGPEHPSWHAVEDNYVFIHNAFRNHLEYILSLPTSQPTSIAAELEKWWSILQVHTRVEDELFMPALEGRGYKVPQFIHDGHTNLEAAVSKAQKLVTSGSPEEVQKALQEIKKTLMQHLEEEEENIMPAMLDKFTFDELWALDSLIINPKLGYCDQDMLMKITFWWFGNITSAEGWALMKNFGAAGSNGKLPRAAWESLVALIPVLKGRDLEDIAGDKLLASEQGQPGPAAGG